MSVGDRRYAPKPVPSWYPHAEFPSTVVTARVARLIWRRLQFMESNARRYASACHGTTATRLLKPAAVPTPSADPRTVPPATLVKVLAPRSTRLIE